MYIFFPTNWKKDQDIYQKMRWKAIFFINNKGKATGDHKQGLGMVSKVKEVLHKQKTLFNSKMI